MTGGLTLQFSGSCRRIAGKWFHCRRMPEKALAPKNGFDDGRKNIIEEGGKDTGKMDEADCIADDTGQLTKVG